MDCTELVPGSASHLDQVQAAVESATAAGATNRLLTFSMGTREVFGIPVDSVAEVSVAPQLDSLAGAQGNVAGMLVWRGEVAYVYFLGNFLQINARPSRILMMLSGVSGRRPFGVLIDKIGEVIDVGHARFHEVPAACRSNQAIASVVIQDNEKLISVINAEALFGFSSTLSH